MLIPAAPRPCTPLICILLPCLVPCCRFAHPCIAVHAPVPMHCALPALTFLPYGCVQSLSQLTITRVPCPSIALLASIPNRNTPPTCRTVVCRIPALYPAPPALSISACPLSCADHPYTFSPAYPCVSSTRIINTYRHPLISSLLPCS